jgi:hypothetical protein
VKPVILLSEDVLIVFDLFDLGLGGFDECSLVVDDQLQAVDEFPHFPSSDPACAF